MFTLLFIHFSRMLARLLGFWRTGVGNHMCWRCALYDPRQRVCTMVVRYGRKGSNDDFHNIKMEPTEFCVWRNLPTGSIETLDFSQHGSAATLPDVSVDRDLTMAEMAKGASASVNETFEADDRPGQD